MAWEGFYKCERDTRNLSCSPQVLMGCQSAVPSIKRMAVTLPSGGVSWRSRTAAPQLSPLRRTPMCSPDTLASASRWGATADLVKVTKWSASYVVAHICRSAEWTGANCGARDPSRWRPRPAALPVRHRKGRFGNVQQWSGCWSWRHQIHLLCLGASGRLQGSVWPPRLPGGNPAEAQHGDCRTRLHQEVHPSGSCHGNSVCSEAHCPCRCSW